jgi:hypothetical protein
LLQWWLQPALPDFPSRQVKQQKICRHQHAAIQHGLTRACLTEFWRLVPSLSAAQRILEERCLVSSQNCWQWVQDCVY